MYVDRLHVTLSHPGGRSHSRSQPHPLLNSARCHREKLQEAKERSCREKLLLRCLMF